MTITLTTRDLYLLIGDRVRHLESAGRIGPKTTKLATDEMRTLLDLFDGAAAREKAASDAQRKQAIELAEQLRRSGF